MLIFVKHAFIETIKDDEKTTNLFVRILIIHISVSGMFMTVSVYFMPRKIDHQKNDL